MRSSRQAYGHTTQRNRGRRAGGAEVEVPFLPTDIAGLQLWLDANDASTLFQDAAKTTAAGVGDVVGAWADKSGFGRDATQTTTAAKPTLVNTDGFPAVQSDGSDDYLINSSGLGIAGSAAFTYVIVFKQISAVTRRVFAHGDNAGAVGEKRMLELSTFGYRFDNGSRIFNESGGTTNYRRTLWQGSAGANYGNHDMYLDNVLATQLAGGGATVPNVQDEEFILAASRSAAGAIGSFAPVRMIEVFAYNKAMSSAERLLLDNYITNKWGV